MPGGKARLVPRTESNHTEMAGLTRKARRGHILLAGDPLWLWPPSPEGRRTAELPDFSVHENRLRHLFKSFLPSLSAFSCLTNRQGSLHVPLRRVGTLPAPKTTPEPPL